MPQTPKTLAILNRVLDPELSLSDFPGGALDKSARSLSEDELTDIRREMDYMTRAEPDPHVRRRLHNAVDFLKRETERRMFYASRQAVQDLAAEARLTGRETCQCGEKHRPGAYYYVSVVDGKKTSRLAGPYPTHAESLAALPYAREKALEIDPGSHFYSFGTIAASDSKPSVLGAITP